MYRTQLQTIGTRSSNSGFTLVEMLVSTGLVVLIMSMFAEIFSTTTQTIQLQKGIGSNDQKARIFAKIIRNDLSHTSYRQSSPIKSTAKGLVPISYGESSLIDIDNHRGFFYFSENDPDIDDDDILQFTTDIGDQTLSDEWYVGHAASLGNTTTYGNQPYNDGGPVPGSGESRSAEVTYFVRNGNLYRRVLLVRVPIASYPPLDDQPSNKVTGQRYFGTTASTTYPHMLRDFDYSVTRPPGADFPWFNGYRSLDNSLAVTNRPLGISYFRYGFSAANGLPYEYTTDGIFFGRFTKEETSSDNFTWPGSSGVPFPVADTINNEGALSNYSRGTQAGEDILLSNVEAMNVEVYDPLDVNFVELGRGTVFSQAASTNNTTYKSGDTVWPIFDTWHASNDIGTGAGAPTRALLDRNTGNFSNWSANTSVTVGQKIRPNFLPSNSAPSLYYEALNGGTTGPEIPELPPIPGNPVRDGGVNWRCVDNRVGLQAIRVTVRYRDPQSLLPRQVTIVHSFARTSEKK